MHRSTVKFLLFALILISAPAAYGQADVSQEKTRQRVSALLQREGPAINVSFSPSQKSQFVFSGILTGGLKNADSMEIVITVTQKDTIGFRVFPKYKGAYINIDKARNTTQLLRQLVQFNDRTFMYWGADAAGDVFTGYMFTLESGFPDEAIKIVLASIKNSDQFVGELRPAIDGSSGQ
jgi:hypothetical protein